MTLRKNFQRFEIVATKIGVTSIRNIDLNEIMHNPVGPIVEAQKLYIEQSRLRERLEDENITTPLVLFDVGLGAAGNTLAALEVLEQLSVTRSTHRKLQIISFEEDLTLLEFALANKEHFELVNKYSKTLEHLLKNHEVQSDKFSWHLKVGSFLESVNSLKFSPEIIFHDPYSPRSNPEMWSYYCFRKLFKLAVNAATPTHLVTYSRATPVRVAMLAAGFFVGVGSSSGLKDETTEASTDYKLLREPFGARWFERWSRSVTPTPPPSKFENELALNIKTIGELFSEHPQFKDGLATEAFTKLLQKLENETIN
jgi:queuine tRNA-ribosyltransferase